MINYNNKNDTYNYNKSDIDYFINVGFVVTKKCNLKCVHCCETASAEEVKLEELKKIVDNLATKNLKKICVTGGEPLIRKDILEILEYIHNKEIAITFSTNGILLNRDMLLKIKPFIDNIRFSIYGNEERHDATTLRKGSYKKVMECLELTRELKVPTGLIMTVMKRNIDDLNSVIGTCEKYGVNKLYLFSLMPTARGAEIFSTEYISPEEISAEVLRNSQKGNACVIKVIDWRIEGQCVLMYENGDVVAQPSYKDSGNKKVVGNLTQENSEKIWEKYPFKQSHIDYYLESH